ncbi:MAG: hypothetical protein E7021_02545 [Alphaproteobacteria bacterium]|nr:hypothetical protein [Alphaproteobacteria bacterium]
MKLFFTFIFLILFNLPIFAQQTDQFEKLFPILTAEVEGKEITPKTTEELEKLFDTPKGEIPRIFVKKLPDDFAEKGSKELYAKVITALILKENEQILGEQYLFFLLKGKADKGIEWSEKEKQFFDYLVEKYDAVVLKTIPTKIADLTYKIDEIPPVMAIIQSAVQTNWGKENMDSPYGQKGWLDRENYDFIKYPNLIEATQKYVLEMNSTPNYDGWRNQRANQNYRQRKQGTYTTIQSLRTYMPEDVNYVSKLKNELNQNKFVYDFDQVLFQKSKQ